MNEKASAVNGTIKFEARKALIINGRKILLMQLDPKAGFMGGEWELPGGRKVIGESDEDTVRREVLEETGLLVSIIKPVDDWELHIKSGSYASVLEGRTFLCRADTTDVKLNDPEEQHIGYRWVTPSQALRMRIPEWLRQGLAKVKGSGDIAKYQ